MPCSFSKPPIKKGHKYFKSKIYLVKLGSSKNALLDVMYLILLQLPSRKSRWKQQEEERKTVY